MSVDYQLIAGIDSVFRAEKNEDGWYTLVRDGEVKRGDLVTDKYRNLTFEVTGFGAPSTLPRSVSWMRRKAMTPLSLLTTMRRSVISTGSRK